MTTGQAVEFAALLALLRLPRRGAVAHPWPQPLSASVVRQVGPARAPAVPQVESTVTAEIDADVAFEHTRWHRVRYARLMPDTSIDDMPLLLDVGEEPIRTSTS